MPGIELISITYGVMSSPSIMSARATPRQPQARKASTASCCTRSVTSKGMRAGMMCVEAPFVYLLA